MTDKERILWMFYVIGSRPQRNDNPGDVEFVDLAKAHGATHGDPRFAVFPTAELGWAAMQALLEADYDSLTVEQALNK